MSCCLFILFFSDAFFMLLLRSFCRCFSSGCAPLPCHPVTFTAFLPIITSTACRRPPVLTSMLVLSYTTPLVCYFAAALHASSFDLLCYSFNKSRARDTSIVVFFAFFFCSKYTIVSCFFVFSPVRILKQLMDETSVDLPTLEKEELDQKTNHRSLVKAKTRETLAVEAKRAPFVKVKDLITRLINRLQTEMNHMSYCDEETSMATEKEDLDADTAKHSSTLVSRSTTSGRRDLDASIRADCTVKQTAANGNNACRLCDRPRDCRARRCVEHQL